MFDTMLIDEKYMKLALLADIHGNNPALETILDRVSTENVDRIVVAGDMIGGPEPDRTIDLLRSANAFAIRGNQEDYFIEQCDHPEKYQGVRWALVRAINRRLSESQREYLWSLPSTLKFTAGNRQFAIQVAHSTPENTKEVFYPGADEQRTREILAGVSDDIYICGHSHRQWMLRHESTFGINPGSAGIPLSHDLFAQFALVEIGDAIDVKLRRVAYDRDRFDALFSCADFFDEIGPIGKAAYYTFRTGKGVIPDFIQTAKQIAVELGHNDLTDEVLLAADARFNWRILEEMI